QGILQRPPVKTDDFGKEPREEDGVSSFVYLLRGKKQAHLLLWHSDDVGTQRLGDAGLSLEEGGETVDTHHVLIMRHRLPLLAIRGEVYLRGFPLLLLPAIIELAIAGQVDQPFVDNLQNVVNGRLL